MFCFLVTPINQLAEAIRTTVMPVSSAIGKTVVEIASATCVGYRQDRSMRFSNKLTYALNYLFAIKQIDYAYRSPDRTGITGFVRRSVLVLMHSSLL